MNWAAVIPGMLELGKELVVSIFDYYAAKKAGDAATAAAIRAQAKADEAQFFDLVDGHLDDNNKLVDAEADKKFGDAVTIGDVVAHATAPVTE